MPPSLELVTACLWQWQRGTGLERFELLRAPEAWHLRGTILVAGEGGPAEVRYEVECDAAWGTRRADVRVRDAAGERALLLIADAGRWLANGREVDAVRGCMDVDLGWSPSTNTLPIRRLALPVGAGSGSVVAAWVRFPDLSIEPLLQEYRRLAERRWRYASNGGAFTAVLDVDDEAVVVEYEGLWRRIGAQR